MSIENEPVFCEFAASDQRQRKTGVYFCIAKLDDNYPKTEGNTSGFGGVYDTFGVIIYEIWKRLQIGRSG